MGHEGQLPKSTLAAPRAELRPPSGRAEPARGVVNDLALPFWAAIPPRTAATLALSTAETLDARLEDYPAALLEAVYARSERLVVRALHRNEHLDEVDQALAS